MPPAPKRHGFPTFGSASKQDQPRKAWADKTTSRHKRGYGTEWTKLRKMVLKRDGYLCQECLRQGMVTPLGVKPYDHAVDHIKPKSQGGTDDPSNLEAICKAHHQEKTKREAVAGRVRSA